MEDAEAFGDGAEVNTLGNIAKSERFHIPTLTALGLGRIDGITAVPPSGKKSAVARMTEKSLGKDTTIGHWEIAGLVSDTPLPTFPNGFPEQILDALSRKTGRGILCNKPYSGTEVIKDYGQQHLATGDLIVYTSADSVFQIAAHEEILPPEALYGVCRKARDLLTGPYAVGRVIARPFVGEYPNFTRTANRHDFSLLPPRDTLLDALEAAGLSTVAVGKITDIFGGRGITDSVYTKSNEEGLLATDEWCRRDFAGLCFVNLVEFDSHYGHRNDRDGYAAALSRFDTWLSGFLPRLRPEDVLLITADHGCDPTDESTDHTREYTPLLIAGDSVRPVNLGTRRTFADIAATIADLLGISFRGDGSSFAKEILR